MEQSLAKKIAQFLFYTLVIYTCYLTSGVYHEKILKHTYVNDLDQSQANFDASIVFTFFPQLLGAIIGWTIRVIMKKYYDSAPVHIPALKAASCSLTINICMLTYNKAVQAASFPAVVMVKSCSLLSVIIVALFCSRVKQKSLKLGHDKIWVGVIVTVGIFMFNFFKEKQKDSINQPLNLISIGLLLISLIGDGLLPDLQAEIKASYKPGVIDMYYAINKYTFIISFFYAAISLQLPYIYTFMAEHSELQFDLIYYSILNAIGQLAVYKMIKLFKQHILPFVVATRKCFTVIVNILYFGHTVNFKQLIGMLLVFTAIMLEVYQNYKQKQQQQQSKLKVAQSEPMNDSVQTGSVENQIMEQHPLVVGNEMESEQAMMELPNRIGSGSNRIEIKL